jgi:short subunit dehydrogenase-like uncharacterized protein
LRPGANDRTSRRVGRNTVMMPAMPIVAVYGATGFVGQLVVQALASRGVGLRLIGRDRRSLDGIADGLCAAETFVATDETGIRTALRGANAVIACAGPFVRHGKQVVDAALDERCHYLDVNGEPAFARYLISRDGVARERGIAIVGSVGLDAVPSDAAAVVACEALDGAPVLEVRITVASNGAPSRGSLRTLLEGLQTGDYAWTSSAGAVVAQPIGAERWTVDLPAPFGFLRATSFGLAECDVTSRSTGATRVVTGIALRRPGALVATAKVLGWLGRPRFLRAAMRPLLEACLLLVPKGGTAEARARARFAIEVRASSIDRTSTVLVTGGDVGEITANAAARCAERVACAEQFPVGVLSPSQAFGARWLLEALEPHGVRVQTTARDRRTEAMKPT